MLKRQFPFALMAPADLERLRELVSYRARIDTIQGLVPSPHAESVARVMYELTSVSKPPRGAKAPVGRMIAKTYATKIFRLALNEMYTQFDDLRKAGFIFQDAVLFVYRTYARKNHHVVFAEEILPSVIRFEHFYSMAIDLEAKNSNLVRCSCCGARNLLTKHLSSNSLSCIFCEINPSSRVSTPTKVAARLAL